MVIHNFEIYLLTVAHCCPNTATKILKLFKTITLYGRRHGFLSHDPFVNKRFHTQDSNRGFLTDEEIQRIIGKEISIVKLEETVAPDATVAVNVPLREELKRERSSERNHTDWKEIREDEKVKPCIKPERW